MARMYQDKRHPAAGLRALIRLAALAVYQGPPLSGPLRVDVVAVFPRPQAITWKTRPMPRIWHIKKPDRDNIDKLILDALTDVIWLDDKQVCAGGVTKQVAAGGESPHLLIRVEPLTDGEIE
jgi:Holliday junction resolvase RusA-like endonuclease